MPKQQLELAFEINLPFRAVIRPARRFRRARWWFAQMRHLVNGALDREPKPAVRPEQMAMRLARQKPPLNDPRPRCALN